MSNSKTAHTIKHLSKPFIAMVPHALGLSVWITASIGLMHIFGLIGFFIGIIGAAPLVLGGSWASIRLGERWGL